MRRIKIIFLFLGLLNMAHAQDFNFEFFTTKSIMLYNDLDTLTELTLYRMVKKKDNRLKVVSMSNPTHASFDLEIEFLGVPAMDENCLIYRGVSEPDYIILIKPLQGALEFRIDVKPSTHTVCFGGCIGVDLKLKK